MNTITRIKHGAMVLIPFDGSCVIELTIVLRQSRCECKMKVVRKGEQLRPKELKRQARGCYS